MKKAGLVIVILVIIAAIIAVVVFVNGGEKPTNANTVATEGQAEISEALYKVEFEGKDLTPNAVFTQADFGEPQQFSEIPSCAFAGTDKVYTYAGMEITVATIDSKDKVYSVYFIDDSVETEEGVKITDSKEKMIEKYGENYEISLETKYTYTRGDVELSFIIENDIITSIEYTLKTDNA